MVVLEDEMSGENGRVKISSTMEIVQYSQTSGDVCLY